MPQLITCTRPSTIASAMDDKGGLMPYVAASTLKTVSEHPDLMTRLSLLRGDSWRDFKPLYEVADERGGGREASDGTNIHMVVNALAQGIGVASVPEPARSDGKAVFDYIGRMGLRIVASELFLVALDGLPEPTAGTTDLVLNVPGTSHLFIADTKSLADEREVHPATVMRWGIQLACYAAGSPYPAEPQRDRWGRPLVDPELVQGWRAPGLQRTHGLVLTVVRGKSVVRPYWVDLERGYAWARLACQVRAARREGKGALTNAPSWASHQQAAIPF